MSPTAMSGESSASPNKMRYQQQKHSNHMKVGMDKKYPHLFQAGLRSGKTFHSDDGSFLHPCSQYPHRASRVRSLSPTSLGPPIFTTTKFRARSIWNSTLFRNPRSFLLPSFQSLLSCSVPYQKGEQHPNYNRAVALRFERKLAG